MLQEIKLLEQEGRWAEIRTMESAIFSGLQGAELARGLLALGKAYEVTATNGTEYRTALRHTEAILALVPAGHLFHTWALHRIACEKADLSDFAGARVAAEAFLADVHNHPSAQYLVSLVSAALGRVYHYQGNTAGAVALFRRSLDGHLEGPVRERVQLLLVWSLAAAGRITEAFAAIPGDLEYISKGHLFAAMARVCLAARDWQGARLNARLALRSFDAGEWLPFDIIQATEVCLIMKRACLAEGRPAEATLWFVKSATILNPWNEAILLVLALNLGERGGECYEAVSASRGLSAGHKRTGLLGAVG